MAIKHDTKYGDIKISMEAIASVAGEAASECYGVVGLANKRSIRDSINEILNKDDYVNGIVAKAVKDSFEVDVYIYVAYGVKITEVISEVQKKVKYVLENTFQIPFKAVNVYVQDVKTIE